MRKEICVSLDMVMTGALIKNMISKSGYSIKDIQNKLKLSCPQPVYRWMKGLAMPSIDNLYTLSSILGMHMEDLLIPRNDAMWILHDIENMQRRVRMKRYFKAVNADG